MKITRKAPLRPLRDRSIAILGYGSQGRAQALNLRDAGFAATEAWWEGTDPETGEGDGVYQPQEEADADDAWVCYVVGIKR